MEFGGISYAPREPKLDSAAIRAITLLILGAIPSEVRARLRAALMKPEKIEDDKLKDQG